MTVLVPDVEDAQRLAAALDEVRRPDSPLAVIAVPPVRGVAFFADSDRQAKLDRWWAHAIPEDSMPVFLLVDERGIAQWLPGLDGRFVVGVATAEDAQHYHGIRNVTVAAGNSLLDIALAAVEEFAGSAMFRDDARGRLEKRLRRTPPEAASRFRRARLRRWFLAAIGKDAIGHNGALCDFDLVPVTPAHSTSALLRRVR
jgi:hypothetical protein